MNFAFEPKDKSRLLKDENIKIKAFKVYRERKNVLYMTPLILVRNRKKESDYLVIYSHGNSCDLGTIYRSTIAFSEVVKMDVLAYDYTGYGISPNKSSEANTYRDLETVLSFAVGQLNHPLDKIILCGYSLGSGPTVEMATRFQSLPFIILLAPLASCLSVISKGKGEKSEHDIFNNIAKMPKVWCDLLIVHGKEDRTISSKHSKDLIQAYISSHSNPPNKGFLLEVEEIDHQNLFSELREEDSPYTITFKKYLKNLLADNYACSSAQNKDSVEKPVEKKIEEKEVKITETDSNEEEEEKKEKDYREMYRRMKQETGDQDDLRRMSEEESEGWNSSVLFSENTNAASSSLAGKLVKYETEYLKDLFTKISVNKVPDKFNKKKDDSPANNQFLLYRKVMF